MTIVKFINEVGFKVREGDVKKVNDSIKEIKNTATKILGAIGIGFSLTKINALVEEFGEANKQIRSAVGELENMDEVQGLLAQKANAARLAYADMSGYVSNLVKAGADIFPVEDAMQFTSTVAKLMKTSGRSDSAIASMMEGFNKSFQKGIVDTETLNKMLEQAPETANVLASSLGVAKSQLLDMATDGKLTVQQLKEAFMDSSGEIDAAFQQTDMTITEGLKNIRNNWGLFLTQLDDTLGVTNTIAKAMTRFSDAALRAMQKVRNAVVWLGDKLGGTDKLLRAIAIAAGALLFAFNFDRITSGVAAVIRGLKGVNKQALLMAAELIIVALLVEDFINFLQGNDSLIGSLLEKAGVDVDKFRTNIIKIWNNIKTILSAVWTGIKNVAIPLFEGIWTVIKTVFSAIGKVVSAILPVFSELIDQLASGNINTDQWVKVGEVIAKVAAAIAATIVVVKTVITVVKTVTTVVKGVSAAISFISSPVGLVIAAILVLVAVGILLWKNWDKIKEFAIKCWNKIKEVWGNVGAWFNEHVIQPIVGFFTGLWDGIVGVFQGIIDWVSSNWQSIVAFIVNPFAGIFNYLYENFEGFRNFVDGIVQGIASTVSNIKDSIVEGFNAAIEWIKALPAQALQWGADIIQGIVDGIKGAIGKVGEAVSGVADKIKGFLGFSEPDEGPLSDFHTYMPDMISLMTSGIKAGRSKVKEALGDLAGDMSIMAQANVVSPGTARTAVGNSSVSKSVIQNVNINNRFEGDRAGQQKSAAAMNKATGDSTAELARALAYAR